MPSSSSSEPATGQAGLLRVVELPVRRNNNAEMEADPTPIPPMNLLLRFLYLGTVKNTFVKRCEVNLNNIETILACVIDMGTARAVLPISTIRKVYQMKLFLRVDEVIIALAYCARQNHLPKLRELAYAEAVTLITNQSDFLLFVNYCIKISRVLEGHGHNGFGHGFRKMIHRWYGKHSTIELANMFGAHRSLYKMQHQDIIKLSHMRISPKPVPNAAPIASTTSNPNAGVVLATIAQTIASTYQPQSIVANAAAAAIENTSAPEQKDREHVLEFAFRTGQKYLKFLNELTELGPGATRLKNLQQLKTNENVAEAVKSIHKNGFTLDQMPAHLLERVEVWEALLPTLSFRALFKYFHTIRDLGFLNVNGGGKFCDKFIISCCNFDKLHPENLCPIFFFILMRLYEQNVRYLATKKAEKYAKKVTKRKIDVNPRITLQLEIMFGQTLANAKRAPANYFVTIDLRKGSKRKHVFRNKHINVFEASILLAFSTLMREKTTLVYTFTGKLDEIQALHNRIPKTNFSAAQNFCETQLIDRTFQTLTKPIEEATALKRKVDVFVVIVDSAARFCRQGQVPTKQFVEYKVQFNKMAKYVVINLARPTPVLHIPDGNKMKGFFEICGFNEDVPKILYALGKHCFT